MSPVPVTLRPGLAVAVAVSVPKEKLAQPATATQQIDLRILAGPDQISQCFLSFIGDRDQRQLSDPVQASERRLAAPS